MASCVCRPCRVDLSTARAARTAAEARSRARRAQECPSPRRRPARCSVAPLGAAAGFADGGGCPAASAAVVVWGSRAPARACYIPFITLTYHLHIILILHS